MSSEIKYKVGNLFTDYAPDKKTILVHGCNAQGVMGSGVARTFKDAYPAAFNTYCKDTHDTIRNERVGCVGTNSYYQFDPSLLLASAITQQYYGREEKKYVSYDAIFACFTDIFDVAISQKYEQVIFPLIGSGLGGGDWLVIEKIIKSAADASMLPGQIELICFVQEQWKAEAYDKL